MLYSIITYVTFGLLFARSLFSDVYLIQTINKKIATTSIHDFKKDTDLLVHNGGIMLIFVQIFLIMENLNLLFKVLWMSRSLIIFSNILLCNVSNEYVRAIFYG